MKIIITLDTDDPKNSSEDQLIETVEYFTCESSKLFDALYEIHGINVNKVGAKIEGLTP